MMNPVTGLSLARVALGVASTVSPDTAARLFRVDPAENRQLSYLMRLFGGREILMGALTLAARGNARRNLVLGGVAVDAVDAVAAVLAAREGAISKWSGVMLAVPAAGAVAAGVAFSPRGS